MTLSILHTLSSSWRDWLRENIAQGCDEASMVKAITASGYLDAAMALLAVREARTFSNVTPLAARPFVDTQSNQVDIDGHAIAIIMVIANPRIVLFGNVLSDSECDELAAFTHDRLTRSPVIEGNDGSMQTHPHRTSTGAMCQRGETALIARIEQRLAALLHWPVDHGEGLQVLNYGIGDEYRPHFDWFDTAQAGPRTHMEKGGQRVGTIIMYLSDVEQGGGTTFPHIGLEVSPRKGCAVFFTNVDPDGLPDQLTLHAGAPVRQGGKLIATKWLRERPYV